MKVIAVVNARSTSSRLPGKCFEIILDGLMAFQIVIRRARLIGIDVVFGTSDDPSDDRLAELAAGEGVEVFRGARLHKIKRWHDCLGEYGADGMVCVDGDDLAFDYDIARRASGLIPSGRADVYEAPPDTVCGLFTYALTREAVAKMYALAPDPETDSDVIAEFIKKAGLKCEEIALKDNERGADVRLTLDYPEDAEFFRRLYEIVPLDTPGPDIVAAVLENGLNKINWHRNQEWAANQRRFNEGVDL